MATPNYATSIAPKPFVAAADNTPDQSWFAHSKRTIPPTSLPVYPSWGAGTYTLNSFERAEVDRYIANPNDTTLATLRLPDAIAKAIEFKTYFATNAYKAWLASVRLDRIAQQKLAIGTAIEDNLAAIPASLDATSQVGTPPSGSVIPPADEEPDQVELPTLTIASGILGGAITVTLACATGGSTIHYRKNGGAWTTYVSAVAMAAADVLDFYASKAGLADSDTDSFTNT